MNSILVRSNPERRARPAGRVLAIEPDEDRANLLRGVLTPPIDLRVVASAADAVRCLGEAMPDLIATGSLLPPHEEAILAEALRNGPGGSHVQIIEVPYFIDGGGSGTRRRGGVFGFLRRRRAAAVRPACDERTLRDHVDQFLAQGLARKAFAAGADVERDAVALQPIPPAQAAAPKPSLVRFAKPGATVLRPPDRRQARRKRADEMPSVWSVRLPFAGEARVVDISNSGVLLESGVKVAPGTIVDLHLIGLGTDICLPARAVRTDVGHVDTFGVKYLVAAAFSRELDLRGLEQAPATAPDPRALSELLTRVLADGERGGSLRARFEAGLRDIFKVRDIQLRRRPAIHAAGTESIYFTVPHAAAGDPWILQVTFEPAYSPSAAEFRLLKTAAGLAAVILELETADEAGVARRATG